ncbi:hypothetical protein Q7C36_007507 [Tachysurus vachellii]|uniref:Uncharacterized protein n=1 Tax=Tachysurus vachellii TaxID=175792 RepID=A0AA88NBJ9_TACVA|nr:hypothetical protein Q7C36_007507 [Tachysurus vachellii]
MFGQEPRLPVDFLLGRVEEPLAGSVHRWVMEHQDRLQLAFEGARARLGAAADRRKARHDLQVRESPLKEGQLVYLRDYSVRGRHKIHDLWSSVVYQIVKAPKEGGVVYTIVPTTDLSKLKHVHRSLLKPQIGRNSSPTLQDTPVVEPVQPREEEMDEGDLFVLVPETPQVSSRQAPWGMVQSEPQGSGEDQESEEIPEAGENVQPAVNLPLPSASVGESVVRRTGRSTAGQHSNVHHLPRSLGPGTVSSIVGSTTVALLRPWD